MQFKKSLVGAAILGALTFGSIGAAMAAPATVSTNINVRSGPAADYSVVSVLKRGQRVEVAGCRGGWCYIQQRGQDGWVSSRYLRAVLRPSQPAFSFQFNFGNVPTPHRPAYRGYDRNWQNDHRSNDHRDNDHRGNDHRGNDHRGDDRSNGSHR